MNTRNDAPQNRTRRWLIGAGAVVVVGAAVGAATWFNVFADATTDGALTVEEAHRQATAKDVYLIDIRRPDEWKRTGIAPSAIPLDMRREDFEIKLRSILAQHGERPVALICARGVRSDWLNKRLVAAGFTNIIDVPEGMVGSGAGPGWIGKSLPLRAATPEELKGRIRTDP